MGLIFSVLSLPLVDLGYAYPLCVIGSILVVLGLFLDGQSTKLVHLIFTHGICHGVGCGLIYVPSLNCCASHFTRYRERNISIATLANPLGGIVYSIMFFHLSQHISYPWTMRVIGFIAMGTSFLGLLFLRPRDKPRKPRKVLTSRFFHEKTSILHAIGYMFVLLGNYTPASFMPSYGKHQHLSVHVFPYITSFLRSGNILGRIPTKFLRTYMGAFNLFIPRIIFAAVLCFCWIAAHTAPSVVPLTVIYGVVTSSALSSLPVLVNALSDDDEQDAQVGTATFIAAFGALFGPPIAGSLLEVDPPNYLHAQIFSGLMFIAGALNLFVVCQMKLHGRWFVKA